MPRTNWLLAIILMMSLLVLLLPPDIIGTRLKQDSDEHPTGRCLQAGELR
jgi:hypothetical protein